MRGWCRDGWRSPGQATDDQGGQKTDEKTGYHLVQVMSFRFELQYPEYRYSKAKYHARGGAL